jgi:hypothetical protein
MKLPVPGEFYKQWGKDVIFCLIKDGIFFPFLLSNEPGRGRRPLPHCRNATELELRKQNL